MASNVITLADGRRLNWHEFGLPNGWPVIYTAGTPVSGLGAAGYDQAARAARLRLVSPDKPGYGASDYHPRRSVASWGEDLATLADHLGLDRLALAGESGGAPFTLAAARHLADRVSVVGLIASGGPMSRADRVGMTVNARVMNWLARNAPMLNTIRVAAMRRQVVSGERALHRATAEAPDAAHAAALRIEFEAVADALRPGARATVQELALIKRPWTFPLSEVKVPVHLWHGALDRNAPIAFARRLARELPDATLHISDSSGHDVGPGRAGMIMDALASFAK
ncbi:alpha/beta fold hydrolase [Paractinoplanes lichenicola]|uniref:Alpha/beta hydrolase n=1 Tax=Paractinoplanes lichenicola TaxID=2802976 RepID=A0ABS1W6G6_9ACTN|nr:alpha/beta hydrolase [Actinoplanes lichenicola]MBL7262143.1 alpha/beta hydrolase [Actinoplanes lichenicola]